MERGFQRRAGVALARLLVVAALQIGAGAERAARAGDDQAADLGLPVVNASSASARPPSMSIETAFITSWWSSFRMATGPSISSVTCLNCILFPRGLWPRYFRRGAKVSISNPYLIFKAALSMVGTGTSARHRTHGLNARQTKWKRP